MRISCTKFRFFVRSLLLFPLLGLAVGCGGSEGTVTGKVYYKGKMLTSGSVAFFPEGKGGSFGSAIGSDGTYTVRKLPRGLAKITVLSGSTEMPQGMGPGGRGGPPAKGMEMMKEKMKEGMKGRTAGPEGGSSEHVKIPDKYTNPEESGLQLQITGSKQSFDIKIE